MSREFVTNIGGAGSSFRISFSEEKPEPKVSKLTLSSDFTHSYEESYDGEDDVLVVDIDYGDSNANDGSNANEGNNGNEDNHESDIDSPESISRSSSLSNTFKKEKPKFGLRRFKSVEEIINISPALQKKKLNKTVSDYDARYKGAEKKKARLTLSADFTHSYEESFEEDGEMLIVDIDYSKGADEKSTESLESSTFSNSDNFSYKDEAISNDGNELRKYHSHEDVRSTSFQHHKLKRALSGYEITFINESRPDELKKLSLSADLLVTDEELVRQDAELEGQNLVENKEKDVDDALFGTYGHYVTSTPHKSRMRIDSQDESNDDKIRHDPEALRFEHAPKRTLARAPGLYSVNKDVSLYAKGPTESYNLALHDRSDAEEGNEANGRNEAEDGNKENDGNETSGGNETNDGNEVDDRNEADDGNEAGFHQGNGDYFGEDHALMEPNEGKEIKTWQMDVARGSGAVTNGTAQRYDAEGLSFNGSDASFKKVNATTDQVDSHFSLGSGGIGGDGSRGVSRLNRVNDDDEDEIVPLRVHDIKASEGTDLEKLLLNDDVEVDLDRSNKVIGDDLKIDLDDILIIDIASNDRDSSSLMTKESNSSERSKGDTGDVVKEIGNRSKRAELYIYLLNNSTENEMATIVDENVSGIDRSASSKEEVISSNHIDDSIDLAERESIDKELIASSGHDVDLEEETTNSFKEEKDDSVKEDDSLLGKKSPIDEDASASLKKGDPNFGVKMRLLELVKTDRKEIDEPVKDEDPLDYGRDDLKNEEEIYVDEELQRRKEDAKWEDDGNPLRYSDLESDDREGILNKDIKMNDTLEYAGQNLESGIEDGKRTDEEQDSARPKEEMKEVFYEGHFREDVDGGGDRNVGVGADRDRDRDRGGSRVSDSNDKVDGDGDKNIDRDRDHDLDCDRDRDGSRNGDGKDKSNDDRNVGVDHDRDSDRDHDRDRDHDCDGSRDSDGEGGVDVIGVGDRGHDDDYQMKEYKEITKEIKCVKAKKYFKMIILPEVEHDDSNGNSFEAKTGSSVRGSPQSDSVHKSTKRYEYVFPMPIEKESADECRNVEKDGEFIGNGVSKASCEGNEVQEGFGTGKARKVWRGFWPNFWRLWKRPAKAVESSKKKETLTDLNHGPIPNGACKVADDYDNDVASSSEKGTESGNDVNLARGLPKIINKVYRLKDIHHGTRTLTETIRVFLKQEDISLFIL